MAKRQSLVLVTALLCCLLLVAVALAERSPGYDLSWWTVDGGGYTFSTGGSYTLGGTVGQPDAGEMRSDPYTLGGGFWGGGAMAAWQYSLYLPVVLKNS